MSKEEQLSIASNIEKNYKCRIIKNNEEPYVLFCASDIGEILKLTNINKNIVNDKFLIKTDTTGGEQYMNYLTYNGFINILLTTRKINLIEFSKKIGLDIKTKIYSCIEADTVKCLLESFNGEEMIEQYKIDKYRIDLFFPKYNIIVECDEEHHKTITNKLRDLERENYIKTKINNCIFIRYDPFDKNFKIFNIINKIFNEIKQFKIEDMDKLLELEKLRIETEKIRDININKEFINNKEIKELELELSKLKIKENENNKLLQDIQLKIQENDLQIKESDFKIEKLENTIKIDNETTEIIPEDNTIFIKTRDNVRSPKVYQYNPITFELIQIYDSIINFTRHFNSSSGSALREAAKNNTIYKDYRWLLMDRNTTDIPILPPTVETRTQSVEFIAMIDIKQTKILEVYPSQKEAAMARNLAGFSTISRAIKQKSISSGHYWNIFNHCSQEMQDEFLKTNKLPEPHTKANGITVIQINPITNKEIKTYKSITEVLKKFQMSRISLNKASENNEMHNGYKWKVLK
uniref:Bro-N domain-containing protein n=1 Tax=viral metagenome TaxID=1070528 RepID=A0A6C0HVD5_9ZZZZ